MSFSKLFLSIFLFISIAISAQSTFEGGIRYFYYSVGFNAPPKDIYAYIDSMYITSQKNDTIHFEVKNIAAGNGQKTTYWKIGNKISLLNSNDTILLYDYSLNINDTFKLINGSINESLILDSIVMVKMENNIDFKHFYLHSLSSFPFPIIWIENIGEKTHGWNYSSFKAQDIPGIQAVCASNSLIWSDWIYYWQYSNSGFEDIYIKVDCKLYDALKKVSIDEISIGLNVFPNPTHDFVFISTNNSEKCTFEMYSLDGKKIENYSVQSSDKNSYQIDLRLLNEGIYYIVIHSATSEKRFKICKLN